jgi:hypothetical protein
MTFKRQRVQLHHQWPRGDHYFVAQCEIATIEEFRDWFNRIQGKHPIPLGACWLVVTEGSPQYMICEDGRYD